MARSAVAQIATPRPAQAPCNQASAGAPLSQAVAEWSGLTAMRDRVLTADAAQTIQDEADRNGELLTWVVMEADDSADMIDRSIDRSAGRGRDGCMPRCPSCARGDGPAAKQDRCPRRRNIGAVGPDRMVSGGTGQRMGCPCHASSGRWPVAARWHFDRPVEPGPQYAQDVWAQGNRRSRVSRDQGACRTGGQTGGCAAAVLAILHAA